MQAANTAEKIAKEAAATADREAGEVDEAEAARLKMEKDAEEATAEEAAKKAIHSCHAVIAPIERMVPGQCRWIRLPQVRHEFSWTTDDHSMDE